MVAVTAISFAAIFFRLAAPTHPVAMAAIRLLLSALLLSPFVFRALRAHPGSVAPWVWPACLAGVFYALHFGLWVWSLGLTTIAASVTLVTATPLLLAVWAAVTGIDRPDRRLWLALALAAVGVAIIGGLDFGTSPSALAGDAMALGGAAAMAGYMIVVRRLGVIDVLAFTGVATLVGGVILALTAGAAGVSLVPASGESLMYLALAALIPQLVGHSALTYALRHVAPTIVGIATLGEPVGATLLGWLLLAEIPEVGTLVGCGVTVFAVGLAVVQSSRPET